MKEDRSIEGRKIKISLDKGKESLKFTCSLFNPDSEAKTQDFLLAVVHYGAKTYRNVLKILTLCTINLLNWDYFCSDMKMTMIVLRKGSEED